MRKRLLSALLAVMTAGGATMAIAGEAEIEAIERVYAGEELSRDDFTGDFLNAVPLPQIEAITAQLKTTYGPALSVRQEGTGYVLETASHRIPIQISLTADGQITGLLFKPAQELTASIAETLKRMAALPGTVSYLVRTDGERKFGRESERKLAVGSAFKLGVLKALMDEIAAGERTWDDIARLEQRDLSLPSGRLQDFPTGSPLTLHTLATLMIAESDNTATDTLMRIVGRDAVGEALDVEAPLTTREFFVLKANPDLAARYRDLPDDPADRRALFDAIAGRGLPSADEAAAPHVEGVEWYVSADRLCSMMQAVRQADVFTVNPGPVEPGNWRSVAFKGGSETGVLSLTAALAAEDGTRHCVVLTVNADESIDPVQASGLFARLIQQLADDA